MQVMPIESIGNKGRTRVQLVNKQQQTNKQTNKQTRKRLLMANEISCIHQSENVKLGIQPSVRTAGMKVQWQIFENPGNTRQMYAISCQGHLQLHTFVSYLRIVRTVCHFTILTTLLNMNHWLLVSRCISHVFLGSGQLAHLLVTKP